MCKHGAFVAMFIGCAALLGVAPESRAQIYPPVTGTVTVGVASSVAINVPLEITSQQLAGVDPALVLYSTSDPIQVTFLNSLGFGADGIATAGELYTQYPNAKITIQSFSATLTGDSRFSLDLGTCAAPTGSSCTASANYNGAIPAGLAVLSLNGDALNATLSGTGNGILEGLLNAVLPSLLGTFDQFITLQVNVTVNKGSQSIVFGTAPASVAVGTTGTVSATGGPSGNAVVFASTTPGTCSISGTTVTGLGAGTCTISANQAGNTNYNAAPQVTQSFAIAKGSQAIVFGAAPANVTVGTTGTVSATGGLSGNPVVFASTTPTTCSISAATVTGIAAGTCTISANQAGNTNYNAAPQVTQSFPIGADPNPPRLLNISTRMQVLTGNDVMIGGFVIGGATTKRVAIVATGPSLAPFGIANPLADPSLRLVRSSDQAVLATNDNWQATANVAQLQAAGLAPTSPLEAAIIADLAPGAYTAIVEGVGNGTGVAVVAAYEVDGPTVPLVNISTRGRVLTGNDVMIGGFVITGSGSQTVVITGTGPSLAAFGIASPLANPTLTLIRSSDQAVLATNDDWQGSPNLAQIQAAGLSLTHPLESAIYATLPPGAYTAILSGVGNGTGVGVIGVYRVN